MNGLSQISEPEFRQILRHRQRKRRNRTSCYACRSRKVKCNKEQPCENCSVRGYPELCTFGSQPSSIARDDEGLNAVPKTVDGGDIEATRSGDHQIPSRTTTINNPRPNLSLESSIFSLRNNRPSTATFPLRTHFEETPRDTFFGSNSLPTFIQEQSSSAAIPGKDTPIEDIRDAIMPMLGFHETRSTYPYIWTDAEFNPDQYLPEDQEIIELFQDYRYKWHVYMPIICDFDEFELQLCTWLEKRAKRKANQNRKDHTSDIAWVGLLSAVLASWCQFSNMSFTERQQKSQTYARLSFQALRLSNFLVCPSKIGVETLLLLGNVLQNGMRPEAAWILLGVTVRMAQSLGFHQLKTAYLQQSTPASSGQKLWLTAKWQDALLSLCFDRPPVTAIFSQNSQPIVAKSYPEAMHMLCNEVLRSMTIRISHIADVDSIMGAASQIENLSSQIPERLISCSHCSNIQQLCEYFAFNLNLSFVISSICRPALHHVIAAESQPGLWMDLAVKCKQNLIRCVEAFVQLHSLSIVALRSWTFVHNALSSALLLGLIGTHRTDKDVFRLQGEILGIFCKTASKDDGNNKWNPELSRAHTRAIAAIRSLHESGYGDKQPDVNQADQPRIVAPALPVDPNTANNLSPSDSPMLFAGNDAHQNKLNFNDTLMDISGTSLLDTFDSILWDPMAYEGDMVDYSGQPETFYL
ncbi:hypothetical protein F5884DRAFT_863844 [Xylogone sp. PMI_703]|nr:hypothetical protein F5884DRAFT_863844 [Xylogone sp. PMI_703]